MHSTGPGLVELEEGRYYLVVVFDVRHETAELNFRVACVHATHDRTVGSLVHGVDECTQCDARRLNTKEDATSLKEYIKRKSCQKYLVTTLSHD